MRAFVGMQRYIAASMQIFQRLNSIELQQLENKQWRKETENKIECILDKLEESAPKLLPEAVFPTNRRQGLRTQHHGKLRPVGPKRLQTVVEPLGKSATYTLAAREAQALMP